MNPAALPLSLQNTYRWIQEVVIGWGLCPFAAKSLIEDRVRLIEVKGDSLNTLLETIMMESERLVHTETSLTSLIVTPEGWKSFDDFWACVGLVEELLVSSGYEGYVQLATFHPDYQFDGEADEGADEGADEESGVSVYTNRAPYPIFHLLSEEEMERVIGRYPRVDEISKRNIQHLEMLGLQAIKAQLRLCGWSPKESPKEEETQID